MLLGCAGFLRSVDGCDPFGVDGRNRSGREVAVNDRSSGMGRVPLGDEGAGEPVVDPQALVKLGAIEKELHREELDTLILDTRESDYGA